MDVRSSPRVLAVDDEPLNLEALRRMFRREFEIVTAASGAEALALLEQQRFDVALVDYAMPGMNGIEFFRRARELAPAMGRILVTGHGDLPAVREAKRVGLCAEVIAKPWNRQEIAEWVLRFHEPGVPGASGGAPHGP